MPPLMYLRLSVAKKLSPQQIERLVELRRGDDPVTIENLALRFGVSERTIYYYLSQWRQAESSLAVSLKLGAGLFKDDV